MVEDKFKQAQEFKRRADGLRDIAFGLVRERERALLMQLAEEYDEMAHSAAASGKVAVSRAIGNREDKIDGHPQPGPLAPDGTRE